MSTIDDLIERCRYASACVVSPVPVVTVDKLRVSAHRVVYATVENRPLQPGEYLLQNCQTPGCVFPRHFEVSKTPYRRREACRNGHYYQRADIQPDGTRVCGICKDVQKAARRFGGLNSPQREALRTFCPQGHGYTEENTYIEYTKQGYRKRHCKTCIIERNKGNDPAAV